jgi:hypothetical protein
MAPTIEREGPVLSLTRRELIVVWWSLMLMFIVLDIVLWGGHLIATLLP